MAVNDISQYFKTVSGSELSSDVELTNKSGEHGFNLRIINENTDEVFERQGQPNSEGCNVFNRIVLKSNNLTSDNFKTRVDGTGEFVSNITFSQQSKTLVATKSSIGQYLTPYALKTDLNTVKTDLNNLKTTVGKKANQSDLDALRTQVGEIGNDVVYSVNGITPDTNGNVNITNIPFKSYGKRFGGGPSDVDFSDINCVDASVSVSNGFTSNNVISELKRIRFLWGFSDNSGFSNRCKTVILGTNIEKVLHVQLTPATDWAPNGNQQELAVRDMGVNEGGEAYVTVGMYDSGSHFTGFYYFVIAIVDDD